MCGLGADKQISSLYDEIIHLYAQAAEFNIVYLFYLPVGLNLFFLIQANLNSSLSMSTNLLRSYIYTWKKS